MISTRRDFLKSVGIGMASLVMAQCTGFGNGNDPTEPPNLSPLAQIRKNWLALGNLAATTRQDYEQGEGLMSDLLNDHRSALKEMIANTGLDDTVADQIQVAFNEAVYHIWRSNAPITCYEPMMVDYTPTSRGQLIQQTSLLTDLSDNGNIDANTIAQARTAIERDIAFLNLSDTETQSLYQEIMDAAGESYDFPSFDELNIEINSATLEAAHFLVEVLLAREDE